MKSGSGFKFIDLFAGIGGLRLGFDAAGGECVFTCEWNKFSQETYRANFPDDDHLIAGDITQVDIASIPAHDLLLAGFPCQPFSIAGVSKKNSLGRAHGFADETQGTLFFEVVKILRHHKPRAFLLENVKNLVSHDKGNTFRVIMHALDELGYYVDHKIIDARYWVPQHRERIFLAGFRKDIGIKFSLDVVQKPDGPRPKLGDILDQEVPEKYTLTDGLWQYLQNYAAKHKAAGNGFGFGLCGPDDVARTLSARYHKDGSEILISQGPNKNPRRLTPRECARLMGFDRPGSNDPWKIPVSDTQAYKQFGNAVAAPVAHAIAEAMAPFVVKSVVGIDAAREKTA